MTILPVSLGLLLLIVIICIFLYIYYRRRSSNKNPQSTTVPENEYSTEAELNYTVLAMTGRPQSYLPQPNGANVVYAVVNAKAKPQVKDSPGMSDASADIYQNISPRG